MGGVLLLEGGVTVDLEAGWVRRGGVQAALTHRQVALLGYLAVNPDRTVTREELLERVWQYSPLARTRAVDMMIRKLRVQIELDPAEPRHVLTVPGDGYRFSLRAARAAEPLVGRARELRLLGEALADGARGIVLCGGPGVGKSRLARHWVAGLGRPWRAAAASDRTDLLGALRAELGVRPPEAGADPVERLADALAAQGGQVLLLDDLDRSPGAAAWVERWLEGAPQLVVVATARRPLEGGPAAERGLLRDESLWRTVPLAGLDLRDAVDLLGMRVGQGIPVQPAELEPIAARLRGVPLALEIAARRLALLSPHAVVQHLASLSGLGLDDEATVSASVRWSVDALPPEVARAVRLLAVLPADVPMDGAIAIVAPEDPGAALACLQHLADNSLLSRVDRGGERWVGLFDAVREVAWAEADEPLRELAIERHAAWSLARARRHYRALEPVDGDLAHLEAVAARVDAPEAAAEALLYLEPERRGRPLDACARDLRSAMGRAEPVVGALLRCELAVLLHATGEVDQGLALATEVARAATDPFVAARAWSVIAYLTPDLSERAARHRATLARWRELGVPRGEIGQLIGLCWAAYRLGGLEEAEKAGWDAVRLAEAVDDDRLRGKGLAQLALVLRSRGLGALADRAAADAIEALRGADQPWALANALGNLASQRLGEGRLEEARALLVEAVASCRASGNPSGEATWRTNLGYLDLLEGRLEDAAWGLRRSAQLHARLGDPRGVAVASLHQAQMEHLLGRPDEALVLLGPVVDAGEALGDARLRVYGLASRVAALTELDRAADAAADLARLRQAAAEGYTVGQELVRLAARYVEGPRTPLAPEELSDPAVAIERRLLSRFLAPR